MQSFSFFAILFFLAQSQEYGLQSDTLKYQAINVKKNAMLVELMSNITATVAVLASNSGELKAEFQNIQSSLSSLMERKRGKADNTEDDSFGGDWQDYATWGIQLTGLKEESKAYDRAIEMLKIQQERIGGITALIALNEKLSKTNNDLMSEQAVLSARLLQSVSDGQKLQKEKSDLASHVQLLLNENASLKKQVATGEYKDVQALQAQNTNLKQQMAVVAKTDEDVKSKLGSTQGENISLKKRVDDMMTKAQALEAQLNSLTANKKDLQQTLAAKESTLNSVQGENASLKKSVNDMNTKDKALETALNGLTANKKTLEQSLAARESTLNSVQGENASLKKSVDDMNAKAKALQTALNGLNANKKSLEQSLATRESSLNSVQSENASLKKSVDDMTAKAKALQTALSGVTANKETLEKSLSTSDKKLHDSESQVSSLKDQTTSLQALIQKIQKQMNALSEDKTDLTKRNTDLHTQADSLAKDKASLQHQDADLQKQNSALLNSQHSLQSQVKTLDAQNLDLTSQNKKLSATIDDVKQQFASLKKVLGALDHVGAASGTPASAAFVTQDLIGEERPSLHLGITAVIVVGIVGVFAFRYNKKDKTYSRVESLKKTQKFY